MKAKNKRVPSKQTQDPLTLLRDRPTSPPAQPNLVFIFSPSLDATAANAAAADAKKRAVSSSSSTTEAAAVAVVVLFINFELLFIAELGAAELGNAELLQLLLVFFRSVFDKLFYLFVYFPLFLSLFHEFLP